MSEREFEIYLSLLSRFLRLKPDQREEIADELRDHLAERLEELTAGGLSREAAIHQALEEFGDAADLAAHFTQLSRRRKRRLIMRCTVGTVVSTAALILIATAFWPQNRAVNLPPRLAAQDQPDNGNSVKQKHVPVSETPEAKIERVLENVTEIKIIDTPLRDVIELIREEHAINVMLAERVLEDASIDMNEVVNFQLRGIKLRSALKIILENLSEPLTFIIEDEVMKITTLEEADDQLSLKVYPVRDLLEGVEGKLVFRGQTVVPVGMTGGFGGGGFGGGGGGFFSVQDEGANSTSTTQPQLNSGSVVVYRQSAGEALISVITTTVQPETWELNGGSGSVEEFNGLLVVRAAQEVHREIEQLLNMMREAAKENAGKKKSLPGVGGPMPGRFGSGSASGFGSSSGGFGTDGFGGRPGGFNDSSSEGFGSPGGGGFGSRPDKTPVKSPND